MRNAARALVTLGFVGICAAIFYLTAQGPTESVALSSRFDAFLKSVVAHTGSDGLLAQLVQQIPVRRIGHTGEFFAFGALTSVLVIVWFSQRMSVGTMMLASLGACMAGSLFDQTHKQFVTVRHFDWKDLPFDAFGYLAAVVVVFAAYGMAKALARRREG